METKASQLTHALSTISQSTRTRMVGPTGMSTCLRISLLTRECSAGAPMQRWSFQPAPTPTSYFKQTSESMIRSAWSSNGRRQLKNSSPVMSRRRKRRQASRTSTSRLTSSCLSSPTRRPVTKLAFKQSSRSTPVRCRIRCP